MLNNVWFAVVDNMMFIKHELRCDFVMPLKNNRKVALSFEDKIDGYYVQLDTLEIEPGTIMAIYLVSADFPRHLVEQIFTNGDGSIVILYLVSSDLDLTYYEITTSYGKRWKMESHDKSLEQNISLSESSAKTMAT